MTIRINSGGPGATELEIVALERLLGSILPAEYREFLTQYNGGQPTPFSIDVPGLLGSPTDVQVFFGIEQNPTFSDIRKRVLAHADRLGTRMIPIACDSGGNLFCLRIDDLPVGRQTRGEVCYVDLFGDGSTYIVAANFREFLGQLRDESVDLD